MCTPLTEEEAVAQARDIWPARFIHCRRFQKGKPLTTTRRNPFILKENDITLTGRSSILTTRAN
jgi:hypothetical protein